MKKSITCIKYNGKDHQAQYNQANWYRLQIKRYMTKYPNASRQEPWNWLKGTKCKWKRDTLHTFCKSHQSLQVKKIQPKKSKNKIWDIAKKSSLKLFEKRNIDLKYLIMLLNKLSKQSNAPKILKKYPSGHCLAAIIEYSKTLDKLGNDKSYSIQQMKQILLSAICIIDNSTIKKPRKKPVSKTCYFIEDTKHDFSTALCAVKKDLLSLKEFLIITCKLLCRLHVVPVTM